MTSENVTNPTVVRIICPACAQGFEGDLLSDDLRCPRCGRLLKKLERVARLLEEWYYPRRWWATINKPTVNLLIEQLWSANGQGERLYQALAPENASYEVFSHLVTRAIGRGIEEGWARLIIPEDPLSNNPVYRLEFDDPDRFSAEVVRMFPDVNWDETIEIEEAPAPQPAEPARTAPTNIEEARARRRKKR